MKLYNLPDENLEEDILRRAFTNTVVKNIDADKRQVEFIISTASEDRYGDKVEVKGWDLKNYKANPVVLFGHMGNIPPIGKTVKIWKTKDALMAVAEFMPRDISAFAHSIFRMYEEGYLRATSVGFRAKQYDLILDNDGDWTGGVHFLKQELLEFSAVPIPANPDALIAARQKGIDTLPIKSWAEEMLDNWGETKEPLERLYGINEKGMETIRRRAAGAGTSIQVPPDVQDNLMKRNLEAIRKAKALKNKSTVLEEITVGGISYELPAISPKDVGTLEIQQKTAEDGTKTYTAKEASDTVAFTTEILEEATGLGDFMKACLEKGADGNDALVLKFDFDNVDISYEVIGMDGDTVIGMKSFEETKSTEEEDEEEDKSKAKPEDDEAEDEKAAEEPGEGEGDEKAAEEADKSSDEDDDDSDSDEDDDDDEDEDDGKKADAPAQTKAAEREQPANGANAPADPENAPMTLEKALNALESDMLAIEDLLDEGAEAKASRHTNRKKVFVASCLRELANRLDGGKSVSVASKGTVTVTEAADEDNDESLTPDQEAEYRKHLLKSMQPMLVELVKGAIDKKKGRLD